MNENKEFLIQKETVRIETLKNTPNEEPINIKMDINFFLDCPKDEIYKILIQKNVKELKITNLEYVKRNYTKKLFESGWFYKILSISTIENLSFLVPSFEEEEQMNQIQQSIGKIKKKIQLSLLNYGKSEIKVSMLIPQLKHLQNYPFQNLLLMKSFLKT